MNKNRRIIGTPQNSSIEDEIRQIFDIYKYESGFEVEKVVDEPDFYEVRLPHIHQYIGIIHAKLMIRFCVSHNCIFWLGLADVGTRHDRMWIRFGYFNRPSIL